MRARPWGVRRLTGAAAAFIMLSAQSGDAATTTTSSFNVTLTIVSECIVQTAGAIADLDFGNQGVLSADVDNSTTFTVQCTDTTPYEIGLDNGNNHSGTTRRMTDGTNFVDYALYRDAARTLAWGDYLAGAGTGVDARTGTGNGATQTLTVYGRVPAQTTPAPATYNDTVTITVEY